MGTNIIKLLILKTNNKLFVTDNYEGKSYFNSQITNNYFDGERLTKSSFKEHWYVLNKIPTVVQYKLPNVRTNERFELLGGESSALAKTLPLVILGSTLEGTEYENLYGLYERKNDYVDGGFENVDFEYELISEDDDFYIEKPKYPYTSNILTQLTTHKDLRVNRPCTISSGELYSIVRDNIKRRIDHKYATISSDYDFCFTVKKRIELTESKTFQVNNGTDKRPKWSNRYVTNREIEIFQMAPKPYNSYTVISPISGENYQDLEKNIDEYINELIERINEPVVDCPHCKGRGVIIK